VDFISRWDAWSGPLNSISSRAPDVQLAEVTLLAPIPEPQKVLCVGLNYADHCAESGIEQPPHLLWFSKVPTSVTGPYADIELPVVSEQLDYEAELVFVIGKRCRNVLKERASEVIFGYCVGDDVSVRDWQIRSSQFFAGKAFDTHAPFGP
jgi:2-keto-4-pentenoate hydratase/2-oxohepta-3-ene-1,7-dioic acid hydratase in catechol pathway